MVTSEQVLTAVDAAKRSCRAKKYVEAFQSVEMVLESLSSSGPTWFTPAVLVRLATFLRAWGRQEDDGSSEYKTAHDFVNGLLKGFGETGSVDNPQYVFAQHVLDKAFSQPGNPKVINEQGWLYFDQCQYDKAGDIFRSLISEHLAVNEKDQLNGLRGVSASLRKLQNFSEADDMLLKAEKLARSPQVRTQIERGWLYFDQGDYDSATDKFEQALNHEDIRDEEDIERARVGRIAALQAGDTRTRAGGEDRGKELIQLWEKTQGLSKQDAVTILLICGRIHSNQNRYPAALLSYNLALAMDSSHKPNPKAWEAKIDTLQFLRRYDEAEQEYLKAQEAFPDSIDLWKEMAYTYYWQKRFPEAYSYYSGEAVEEKVSEQRQSAFKKALESDVSAAEWTVVLLRKMNEFGKAERKVNEALARFGNTPGLLCEKAAIHFGRQEYERAIEIFDRALNIDQYYAFAHQWRAASFRKLRKPDEAKTAIAEAQKKLPAESGLWDELGWISFDQNDLKTAEESFAKAIELDPYLIQRRFSQVEVLARQNLNDNALKVFLELQDEFPNDAEVAEQLGWFCLRVGRLDEAKEQFDSIVKIDPQATQTDPKNVPGINGLGGYYLEQLEYETAAENFRTAAEAAGYEPQYRINLAWAQVRQVSEPGEMPISDCSIRETLLSDAAANCREALKRDPYNAKAYICLGVIAFKRNSYLDAEGYFRKSVALNAADGGQVELGALYVQMGRDDEAKEALAKALTLNPNDARAHIELGNLLLTAQSNQAAVRECRRAISVEPNNYETHRALAIAFMRAGQYEEADNAVRQGLKLVRPDRQWQLKLVLSQILIRLGDDHNKDRERYEDALQHIYDARRFSPFNADIHFHAGIAQCRLEDYGSARRSFVDCVKANRDRYDAERYSKLVKSAISQERKIAKVNAWGGWALSAFCLMSLVVLWLVYLTGLTLAGPLSDQVPNSNATANSNVTANSNAANNTNVTPGGANIAQNANVPRNANVAQNRVAPKNAKVAQNANAVPDSSESVPEKSASPKTTPALAKLKEEPAVDKQTLTVMSPILLGLMVVGLLLPNLNKIKLPGGIEADISEPNKQDISTGPKGEIGFGSSLPNISPGPR